MRKIFTLLFVLVYASIFFAACGTSNNGNNTVELSSATFTPGSITIKKGQSITLMNQTDTTHVILNGSWKGNTPDPLNETGAPVANNIQFDTSGQSQSLGPFNVSGTFHYFCSIHDSMNLTVVVQ